MPPLGAAPDASIPAEGPHTRQRVLAILRDLVDNSYISGVTLACRKHIPLWDRLFWVSVVLVAGALAVWWTYLDLSVRPSTVEVLSTTLEMHAFPFPAVVVCPKLRVRRRAAMEYIRRVNRFGNLKFNESAVLPALQLLQDYRLPFWFGKSYPDIPVWVYNLFRGIDLRQFMKAVAPNCKSVFVYCLWSGKPIDCCRAFRPTVTNTGHCFSFNSYTTPEAKRECPLVPPGERPQEAGDSIWYSHRPNKTECVLARSGATGSGTGLQLFLRQSDALDSVVPDDSDYGGYEVTVQAGNEKNDIDKGMYLPEPDLATTTLIKVTYSETTADPWMHVLPPGERGCLFEDEAPMDLFRHINMPWYTQEACLFACRMAFLAERCHCYPYLIQGKDNQCSLEEYSCILALNERLFWVRVPEEIGLTAEERNHSLWPDCRPCLPMCSLSIYDAEFDSFLNELQPGNGISSYVNVFYRDLYSAIKYTERRGKETSEAVMTYAAATNLLLGASLMSVVQLAMYAVQVAVALSRPLRAHLEAWRLRWWRPETPPPPPPTPPLRFAL